MTVKAMERMKKSVGNHLERLNDQERKDDLLYFEELGVDSICIDEADMYKNLFVHSKMTNVAGLAQSESQKALDMFMKTSYLNEKYHQSGVTFATGTPISNSLTEMYTMMRYLMPKTLGDMGFQHFDAWAGNFCQSEVVMELAPEGSNYRARTRMSKFKNVPELMTAFAEVADIKDAAALNLPIPKAIFKNVALPPSPYQEAYVSSLGERAQAVRDREVKPEVDNLLLITNDGRKVALDERLMDPTLARNPNGKIAVCADNVYQVWRDYAADKATQLVFCDLSTPQKGSTGKFTDLYHDLKDMLLEKGIPKEEIAFVHDAKTATKKKELFQAVCAGNVRVLIGSTFKMGAGTNVQTRLKASHDLDCPWRPRDLEQRHGRTIRRGNQNEEVFLYRYVTEGTFDAYSYQVIENKQRFINQIMTSKNPVREIEDVDDVMLNIAEIKALAAGDPLVREKMELELDMSKMELLKRAHLKQRYAMEQECKTLPERIQIAASQIVAYHEDIALRDAHPETKEQFTVQLQGTDYQAPKDAAKALHRLQQMCSYDEPKEVGTYRGFCLQMHRNIDNSTSLKLVGSITYGVKLSDLPAISLDRLRAGPTKLEDFVKKKMEDKQHYEANLIVAEEQVKKPFAQETELLEKKERLTQVNALLLNQTKTETKTNTVERETQSMDM